MPKKGSGVLASIRSELGTIYFAEEVIATIAGLATNECYGIVGMASRKLTDDITEILRKDSLSRGVQVTWQEEQLHIEVHVVVGYGVRISEVARNVISQVKYTIQQSTELPLSEVIVNVRSVKV